MDETNNIPQEDTSTTAPETPAPESGNQGQGKIILAVIVGIILLAAVITAAVFLIRAESEVTSQIRDVFIIFMALEFLIIGIALIILIIQLAVLTNLLRNEVKPILDSTNETVNTMRGTVTFLSNNLAEPVIKLNGYLAGLKKLTDLLRPGRD